MAKSHAEEAQDGFLLKNSPEREAVISPLTPSETEILQYIAQVFLNKQIAAELSISE